MSILETCNTQKRLLDKQKN